MIRDVFQAALISKLQNQDFGRDYIDVDDDDDCNGDEDEDDDHYHHECENLHNNNCDDDEGRGSGGIAVNIHAWCGRQWTVTPIKGGGSVCRKLWMLLLFQQSATAQIHKCLLGAK